MQDYHAEFVEIYNKNITRPGADRLLNWLETTDFFTAPASTRFHGACECGLVMHSINVYNAMMQHFFTEGESAESYAICGLLHDLCKANFYKVGTRNVKNDVTGQWEKVPFYQVADQLPYVQTAGKDKITPEFVRSLTFDVTAKDGTVHSVALRDIATVEETESLSSIRRLNQRRYIDVTADIAEGCNVTLVTDAAEDALASFSPSDGTTIGFTGERESIVEALRQLVLMLAVGILLVYLVMVAQFQDLKSPFIVMFTIPLAFTGGFLALLIAGLEINLLSMLGMIMLVGIIVNNGIVLVDYINQLRIGGMDRREAIADAAVTRLRPILMTSITTILGLIVMALGQSEATSLIQPLAVTCIGGLLYATLMTLYVVPVMYDALSKKALYHVDEADLELSEK